MIKDLCTFHEFRKSDFFTKHRDNIDQKFQCHHLDVKESPKKKKKKLKVK